MRSLAAVFGFFAILVVGAAAMLLFFTVDLEPVTVLANELLDRWTTVETIVPLEKMDPGDAPEGQTVVDRYDGVTVEDLRDLNPGLEDVVETGTDVVLPDGSTFRNEKHPAMEDRTDGYTTQPDAHMLPDEQPAGHVGMEDRTDGYNTALVPTAPPESNAALTGSNVPIRETRTRVVRPDEWLYGIARNYGVPAQSIILANGLQDPSNLAAGTRLTIPGSDYDLPDSVPARNSVMDDRTDGYTTHTTTSQPANTTWDDVTEGYVSALAKAVAQVQPTATLAPQPTASPQSNPIWDDVTDGY